MTDEELCELLSTHLSVNDASSFFSAPPPSANRSAVSDVAGYAAKKTRSSAAASSRPDPTLSIDQFVSQQLKLVEMERQAEVDAATEACTVCSPETAQARGRALLNLRVADMEGGLMGRTLVTLVLNKGYTGGGAGSAADLPPHKFGGHDVVALRAAKGSSEGPPICSGENARCRALFRSPLQTLGHALLLNFCYFGALHHTPPPLISLPVSSPNTPFPARCVPAHLPRCYLPRQGHCDCGGCG